MAQYRKRPEIVDAILWDGNVDETREFFGGDIPEGVLTSAPGSLYIIKKAGILSGMLPNEFAASYEPLGPTVTDGPAPSTL